jgi:hypothetical protein
LFGNLGPMPLGRLLVSILGSTAVLASASSVAVAQPSGGGNSSAAHACQQRGYMNFVRGDGSTFDNTGDCVSYAAKGGALVPVSLSASFVPDPSREVDGVEFEDLTVTGSGLEPGGTVSYSYIGYGTDTRTAISPTVGSSTVASDGSFHTAWETGCPLDHSFEFYATTAYGLPIEDNRLLGHPAEAVDRLANE